MTASALLFATAASAEGGPAAALPVGGSTLVARLLGQLETLGVARAWLVTRPEWKSTLEAAVTETALDVTVIPSDNVGDDLRTTAELAGHARGRLVVANAHILTHREALARLLADPRIVSGLLGASSGAPGRWSFGIRTVRGRVVSADSAYHRVDRPNGHFLGFVKVDPRDREHLVAAARKLAELATEPRPERWEDEFGRKVDESRVRLWRTAVERETGSAPDPPYPLDPASLRLDGGSEAELALRLRALREDVVALLVVALVRTGVHLSLSSLREFFYATPLSAPAADSAVQELSGYDEDRIALASAVKANDGFFTTFFVSPYSKYLARFAARRGWTPNAITTLSLAIGAVAAGSFAVGNRLGLVLGAVLLQVAFTVDCVDGQLARYTCTFSRLGAWLDSVFDRAKEYLVYAGLAVGAARGFGDDVWTLAAAALALQTFRHLLDFSYGARHQEAVASRPQLPLEHAEDAAPTIDVPSPGVTPVASAFDRPVRPGATAVVAQAPRPVAVAPAVDRPRATPEQRRRRLGFSTFARQAMDRVRALERWSWTRWGMQILALPIGERFALISVTAALATPRVTFIALLVWGGIAAIRAVTGRILREVAK